MYTNTTAVLSVAPANQSLTLYDGRVVNVFSGNLYFMIQATNTTNQTHEFLECVEVSFTDYAFNYTNSLLGSNFSLFLSLNGNNFGFTSSENFTSCNFVIDASAMGELPSSSNDDNGGGSSPDTILSSFNGHFGSYKDGASVIVAGLTKRTYTVVSSSLGWDSPTTGGLVIVYKLKDTDGNILEAPHVLLTLKG